MVLPTIRAGEKTDKIETIYGKKGIGRTHDRKRLRRKPPDLHRRAGSGLWIGNSSCSKLGSLSASRSTTLTIRSEAFTYSLLDSAYSQHLRVRMPLSFRIVPFEFNSSMGIRSGSLFLEG
jgi:hypothetical protein